MKFIFGPTKRPFRYYVVFFLWGHLESKSIETPTELWPLFLVEKGFVAVFGIF